MQESQQSESPTHKNTALARKEKKKKTEAFKTFLNSASQTKVTVANASDHQQNHEQMMNSSNCRVCHIDQGSIGKKCGYCKEIACGQHMRKKRKDKVSGKFVRICDICQDNYLYEKYMKFQLKAEDSLIAQQAIVLNIHNELAELVQGKKTKIILLKNKRNQIQRQHKEFLGKLIAQENELNHKQEKLQLKYKDLQKMKEDLTILQQSLPRPLDDDYKSLSEENDKITKELVKYEKQCYDAMQIKSKREKEVYEKYYQWERKEKSKTQSNDKDCIIF